VSGLTADEREALLRSCDATQGIEWLFAAVERILAARAAQGSDLAAKVARVQAEIDRMGQEGRGLIHRGVVRDRLLRALADPADTGDGSGT